MTSVPSLENATCSLLDSNLTANSFLNVTQNDSNESFINNFTDTTKDDSAPTISRLHFLFIFMDVLNVLGCIVVIMLIYKDSKLKDTPGRLLLNQTLADGYFGVAFLLMNIPIFTVTDKNLFQKIQLVHIVLMSVANAEGMHSLTMIMFTLHLAICNPIFYKLYCRTRYVVIFVTVSWLLNLFVTCSAFLVEDITDNESDSLSIWLFLDKYYLICISIVIVLNLLIPFVIVVFCYARMTWYARHHQNSEVFTQSRTKVYIQQAKGIILISIGYFVTQVPGYIFETLNKALDKSDRDDELVVVNAVLVALVYLYMVLKLPIILYGFKSYRRVLLNMCCRRSRLTGTSRALERRPCQVHSVTDIPTGDRPSGQSAF